MDEVSLVADVGRKKGSSEARRLRRDGKVPGVLYGHGIDPVDVAVNGRELRNALTTESGLNALISLDVAGTRHLAMARQLQRHPTRRTIDHVDFVIVRRDEVISAEVPVHLIGEAEKVEKADGMVEHTMFTLMVHAKAIDIPAAVEVDISELAIGDVIRVGDLKLPAGVTTEVDPEEPVVAGATTRMAAELEEIEAEEEAAAETDADAEAEAEADTGAAGEASAGESTGGVDEG